MVLFFIIYIMEVDYDCFRILGDDDIYKLPKKYISATNIRKDNGNKIILLKNVSGLSIVKTI